MVKFFMMHVVGIFFTKKLAKYLLRKKNIERYYLELDNHYDVDDKVSIGMIFIKDHAF